MSTFKDHLLGKGHSKANVDGELRQLGYFLTWCDRENMEPEEAGYRDLLAYVQHLRKRGGAERSRGIKAKTVQLYIGVLRHFFAWQIKHGRREDNPAMELEVRDVQRGGLQVMLTRQELERIYNSYGTAQPVNAPPPNGERLLALSVKRNKALLGLLVYQGLTSHELQGLTIKSLELRAGKVHVEGGRKHNARTLALDAAQVLDLMEYTVQTRPELLKLRSKGTPPPSGEDGRGALFLTTGTGSRLHAGLGRLLKQVQRIEPKVRTLQQLRASVITHWIKTLNLREAQHRAGHRYVSSTEAYLIHDLEGLAEDVERFHPIG